MITPNYSSDLIHVTSVLSWAGANELDDWIARVGVEKAQSVSASAKRLGSQVDKIISAELLGKKVKGSERFEVKQALVAWKEWRSLNIFKAIAVQKTVEDHELGIVGTPDCLSDAEVFDWKVGKRITWKYVWQINEYARMVKLPKWRVVRFDPYLGVWEEKSGQYSEFIHWAFRELLGAYRKHLNTKEAYQL